MNNKLFMAMSALLCLAACNTVEKDVDFPEKGDTEKKEVIITATSLSDTKTVLDNNYTTVLWKPADEIKVFSAGEDSKFTSLNSTASSIAQFRGTISVITGISEGVGYDSNIYGLYPYDADATLSNGVITTTLPSTQTAIADSFADDLFITVGKSETLSMGFYNVCSGLRFSFSEGGYTSVTLSSNNGEAFAGTFSVGFDNSGKPVIQSVSSPSTSITVNAPTGGFVANTWYYIICLPGTVSGGITLSATNANASGTYKISSSLTFSRGLFKQVANLESRLEMTQPNNEIWYEAWDVVTPYNLNAFGANIVSNTYSNGKGVIRFDNDITQIGYQAFYRCNDLRSISLPESTVSIGIEAFAYTGLNPVIQFPSQLETISDRAFQNCTGLLGITLPSSLRTIGAGAFEGCNGFESLVIPGSVTSIGASAFKSCHLINVSLPDNLTAIPDDCFAGSLTDPYVPISINIPSSLVSIGAGAFGSCTSFPIEALTLPGTITDIGNLAFVNCSNIKKVYVQSTTAARIGVNAFMGCDCNLYVPTNTLPDYYTYSQTGYYLPFSMIYSVDAENIEPVDLGLSVKWAPYDIGGAVGYYGTFYTSISPDPVRNNWGGKWRLPSIAEWNELKNQCTWSEWFNYIPYDGIRNYVCGLKVTGINSNSIYLLGDFAESQDGDQVYECHYLTETGSVYMYCDWEEDDPHWGHPTYFNYSTSIYSTLARAVIDE